MKKYIIQYKDYNHILELLGHDIPHSNLKNVKAVIVDLTEEEYEALVGAGVEINASRKAELLGFFPSTIPYIGVPPPIFGYLNLDKEHAAGFTGAGVKVCILDTGCHDNHHTACPQVTRIDFTGTGVETEVTPHGGRGCMIIGQTKLYLTTTDAFYGIAYGCDLYAGKTFNYDENDIANFITGVEWCIENEMDIINVSLDLGCCTDFAIESALAAGIIVVCASGNTGYYMAHPANVPGVVAVNAVSSQDDPPYVFGSYVTYDGTQGVDTTFYSSGAAQTFVDGTSQAAFNLSGVLAIYKQKYPELNCLKAKRLLQRKGLAMDGYAATKPTTTRNTKLNYITGGGFVAPFS